MCFTDKLHCSQIFTAQLESPKNDPTFSERCRAQRRACEAKPDWTRLAWRVLREKKNEAKCDQILEQKTLKCQIQN